MLVSWTQGRKRRAGTKVVSVMSELTVMTDRTVYTVSTDANALETDDYVCHCT
jgi:hypothetical protein